VESKYVKIDDAHAVVDDSVNQDILKVTLQNELGEKLTTLFFKYPEEPL